MDATSFETVAVLEDLCVLVDLTALPSEDEEDAENSMQMRRQISACTSRSQSLTIALR
jgi:hypothetical protein